MTYVLFLDDKRNPKDVPQNSFLKETDLEIVTIRSFNEGMEYVEKHGFPQHVSFDYFLDEEFSRRNGALFSQFLLSYELENQTMPSDFSYFVHSDYDHAKKEIDELFGNYVNCKLQGKPW